MTKATGAWDSLIKGVSEQVAHQRFPGQHWDQLNMVSDPVRGLARRAGSRMVAEKLLTGVTANAATLDDVRYYREQSLYIGVTEYSLSYRSRAKVAGSTMPGLTILNKTEGRHLTVSYSPSDTSVLQVLDKGLNSITAVGKFLLLAGKGTNTTYSQVDMVNANPDGTSNSVVAWIKGGAYSRTYTIGFKHAASGNTYTVSYTTPASYYPGTLNTSDIPATVNGSPNPDYQKQVNDRVYAYQTAVNQWIGTAAQQITPAYIAGQLASSINNLQLTSFGVGVRDSTVIMDGASSISVDDGGDGSLALGVGKVVKQASDLSTKHRAGKVVQIKPQSGSSQAYYVQAEPKVPGTGGWTDVTWKECAGVKVTPGFIALLGCIVGDTLFLGTNASVLQSISGVAVPGWASSSSGDLESQSLPSFLGGEVHYMRMFQDRLFIVHNATVFMSASGDYFNFFRTSALTVNNNDPIEVYALGSEDDVITSGTLLDRNLILFGKQWQYAVPGRDSITPTSAFVAVQSGYKDSNDCPPETSGNLIFFTQQRNNKLTVQQMQTGAYADTLTAYELTQQLNSYLNGRAQQIVAVTSPSAMFVRTNSEDHGFWVYSYLDSAGNTERLFDSWSKWTFNAALGSIVSMTAKDGDLLCTTLRNTNSGVYLVTDRFTLNTDLGAPHLDSQRPYNNAGTLAYTNVLDTAPYAGAYTVASGQFWMVGDVYAGNRLDALIAQVGASQTVNLMVGAQFDNGVTLTNPYMRDKDGKAILDGRLTLGTLNVTLFESSAMTAWVSDLVDEDEAFEQVLNWTARSANSWKLNTQETKVSASVTVSVFKEIRDCKVRLAGRSWLPLTISSIEWTGQFFTRRRG